ncbi:MAG: glycerate kinase [Lachnospiraceae bacterium]|nr:glycerate kinase [Lachnospiraceae bacterium]
MKVVVAMDSFKGSMSSMEAGEAAREGIDAFFPIVRGVTTPEEAMNRETAKKNMSLAVEQVFRLLKF